MADISKIEDFASISPTEFAQLVKGTPDSELLDIPVGEVVNMATNEVEIVMEREYVVTYDCYVAGIEVTLDTTDR